MKFFACGLGTETNSFCPIPTSRRDFKNDLFEGISSKTKGAFELWGEAAAAANVDFARGSNLWAMPAGPVLGSTVDALHEELLAEIEAAMPMDVLLLYMHGAMMSDSSPEPEADLVRLARERVGANTIIGVELDPHANLSRDFLKYADVIVEYKEWPHDDIGQRAQELFDICLRAAKGNVQPVMGMAEAGILSLIDTKFGTGQALVAHLHALEAQPKVLSASINHGFAWSDKAALGTKALVVTDNDQDLADDLAQDLAAKIFDAREEIAIGRGTIEPRDAIEDAIANATSDHRYALCEGADALLCGGAGDATHLLQEMIGARVQHAVFAPLWDPVAVDLCKQVGEGGALDLRIGGKASRVSGAPLDVHVQIKKIVSNYRYDVSPTFGFEAGDSVCVTLDWGMDIVLSANRFPILSPSLFHDFDIDLSKKSILGLKAFRMAKMAFGDIVDTFLAVRTPGAMSEDLQSLDFRNAPKTLWPLSTYGDCPPNL